MKYGITLHTKQMTKVNELTLLHLYASVAINHHRRQHKPFKHLSLAHSDLFRELREVSASFINSDLI